MTTLTKPVLAKPTWPRSTTLLLIATGALLALTALITSLSVGPAPWHPARDAELRATYDTFQETGTLLIKPTGSGSYGVQAPAPGPLTFATWDDDPGAYIIASLMGAVTQSASPYPGLMVVQALLVSIPLLWLPLAVARFFRRARAGFALLALPVVVWVLNYGTLLVGTGYGLSDGVSTLPVYALYGIAASLAFLSLSLLFWMSTYKLTIPSLIALTLFIGVLAGVGNLTRSLSGVGVALAVGVVWWVSHRGRLRVLAALLASMIAFSIADAVPNGIMSVVNDSRVVATGQPISELPDAHTLWHSMYLGLSYPQPLDGRASRFDVTWSDEFAWERAREIDPEVIIASEEYDEILQGLYFRELTNDPVGVLLLYVKKFLYLVQHFWAALAFITAAFVAAALRDRTLRRRLGTTTAIALPTVMLGILPPVLVMPMLYYYSELFAALGLLIAVSVGAVVWLLTSLPGHIRAAERRRTQGPLHVVDATANVTSSPSIGRSVVLDEPDSLDDGFSRARRIGEVLSADDEVLLVYPADTAGSDENHQALRDEWGLPCDLILMPSSRQGGNRLRSAALATRGQQVLVSGCGDPSALLEILEAREPDDVSVHFGSGAASNGSLPRPKTTWGHRASGRVAEWMRAAILHSRGADGSRSMVAPGGWLREVSVSTREPEAHWFDELATVAHSQQLPVHYADDSSGREESAHDSTRSPRTLVKNLVATLRIAMNREEYASVTQPSTRSLAPSER